MLSAYHLCLLTLFGAFTLIVALFEQCNHVVQLRAGQKIYINSPYYPLQYPVGSSCRYTVKAPLDYALLFKCNIQLNTPPDSTYCQNEIFHYNREGSEFVTDSEYFCGSGTLQRQSFLNRAVISYISKYPTTTTASAATFLNTRNVATTTKTKAATVDNVAAIEEATKSIVANGFYVNDENKTKNNNNNDNSINIDNVHESSNNQLNSNKLQQDSNNNNNDNINLKDTSNNNLYDVKYNNSNNNNNNNNNINTDNNKNNNNNNKYTNNYTNNYNNNYNNNNKNNNNNYNNTSNNKNFNNNNNNNSNNSDKTNNNNNNNNTNKNDNDTNNNSNINNDYNNNNNNNYYNNNNNYSNNSDKTNNNNNNNYNYNDNKYNNNNNINNNYNNNINLNNINNDNNNNSNNSDHNNNNNNNNNNNHYNNENNNNNKNNNNKNNNNNINNNNNNNNDHNNQNDENNQNNYNNETSYYSLPVNIINTIVYSHTPSTTFTVINPFTNTATATATTVTNPIPVATTIASKPEVGVSDSFTYVAALLSNTINSSIFLAPTTKKQRQPTKVAPTTSATTSLDAIPAVTWRNGSSTSSATLTSAPLASPAGKRSEKPSTLRHSKIVTGNGDYVYGGGSFSCLVETVEPQCDCGWIPDLKVASSASVATVNEFPSMAGVLTVKYNRIFCGAAIIHHRYLLSAAHCFITPSTNRSELIRVVVGEHDLSTVLESLYTRYYDIEAILPHEYFRSSTVTVRNDIALLRTRLPIEWSRAVGPACLPFRSITGTDDGRKPPVAGQRVVTAGWGTVSFGGPQSTRLLKTTLDVITAQQCQRSVRPLPPATFCTYTPGRDTCQYDSGGALYVLNERYYAVGIVSYGFACATQQPSVNTKVASFLRWIKKKTPEVRYCVK